MWAVFSSIDQLEPQSPCDVGEWDTWIGMGRRLRNL
jgi:hypothetical protein